MDRVAAATGTPDVTVPAAAPGGDMPMSPPGFGGISPSQVESQFSDLKPLTRAAADEEEETPPPVALGQTLAEREMVLNLGDEVVNAERDAELLHLSAEILDSLQLAPKSAQRQKWAQSKLALPDGSWPIPNVGYLKKAIQAFPGRAKGNEGKIKAWILKRAKALNYTGEDLDKVEQYGGSPDSDDKKNMSQPTMYEQVTGQDMSNAPNRMAEHLASIRTLRLDHTSGGDGLIWKVLCKTGTLALSPGPGQVDVDKPLNLTADIFSAVKTAYDDKAFEHVTVPETHANGTLENLGVVQNVDLLSKAQAMADARLSQVTKGTFAADPESTQYLLGGIHFTDPKAREKAENGSILNCSVGLKFNYRRKRDGKLFPVALEHVALTNQPWVDGLGAFGGGLSQPLFDQDKLPTWDGVFVSQPSGTATPRITTTTPNQVIADPTMQVPSPKDVETSSTTSLPTSAAPVSLPSTMADENKTETTTPTLEQILASQQATIEQLQSELRTRTERETQLSATVADQGQSLHLAAANERVAELQRLGVPPAVLKRYKEIRLAAYAPGDGGTLQLSVREGDSTVDKTFGPIEQAEYLLAAMPIPKADDNVIAITSGVAAGEALRLTQESQEVKIASASEKADEVERSLHPERFGEDGKRISVEERHGKAS